MDAAKSCLCFVYRYKFKLVIESVLRTRKEINPIHQTSFHFVHLVISIPVLYDNNGPHSTDCRGTVAARERGTVAARERGTVAARERGTVAARERGTVAARERG